MSGAIERLFIVESAISSLLVGAVHSLPSPCSRRRRIPEVPVNETASSDGLSRKIKKLGDAITGKCETCSNLVRGNYSHRLTNTATSNGTWPDLFKPIVCFSFPGLHSQPQQSEFALAKFQMLARKTNCSVYTFSTSNRSTILYIQISRPDQPVDDHINKNPVSN